MTDTVPVTQALKPCPFCGVAEGLTVGQMVAGGLSWWLVQCHGCNVSQQGENTRAAAIAAWNTRAAEQSRASTPAAGRDDGVQGLLRNPAPHEALAIQAHDHVRAGDHRMGYFKMCEAYGKLLALHPPASEWALVNRLRDEEADSVTILCDNPEGPPNNAVECCGFWTGFAERRFEGETIRDALSAAVAAKDEAARIGYPDPALHLPVMGEVEAENARLREALSWIALHGDDQGMNHVNFRIGAASRARATLSTEQVR